MYKFLTAFFVSLLFFVITVQAQFKLISESKPFDEPSGDCGIVQMKNGNTVFLNYDKKEGVSIRIYDKAHAEKAANNFAPAEDMKKPLFKTMFEVNNDVAIFISCFSDGMPALMRFIVDGNTGIKKEEKKIIHWEGKGGVPDIESTAFTINNDPVSGNYAISAFKSGEKDDSKRIQISLYNADNTEIKKTWLTANDTKGNDFFIFKSMAMVNATQLKIFLYTGRRKSDPESKAGRFVMASVNIKNEAPTYTTINIPEETEFENCFTHYSLALNKLFLIVTEPAHPHDAAIQYYIKIDPETDKTEFQKFNGISEAMNGKLREKYSGTGNYIGPMRQFTNNDDGSFTTVYENGFTYSMLSGGQNYSTGYTGKIMVSTYNSKAEILSEYLVPKLYINTGSPYKDLLFINNGKNSYMCINDTRRNNKVSKNNYAEVGGIGDCDAFYYKLEGTDNFPGRDYVFGDQDKSRLLIANRYANYSKAENSLAAMRLTITPEKRKQCNIVWLQPQ